MTTVIVELVQTKEVEIPDENPTIDHVREAVSADLDHLGMWAGWDWDTIEIERAGKIESGFTLTDEVMENDRVRFL